MALRSGYPSVSQRSLCDFKMKSEFEFLAMEENFKREADRGLEGL